MPRRIQVTPHLSGEALEQRYRASKDTVEQSHFQILWLLSQGKTTQQVAETTGYSPYWIGQIVKRYNQGGADALGDRRHHNPGGRWLLNPEQQQEFEQALTQPPSDGGGWNSTKASEWIAEKTGKKVYPQRGWDYLRLAGYLLQVPRPYHVKSDPEAQETFKKNTP